MAAWHLKNDFTKVTIQKSQKHIDAFVCQVAGPKKTPFCVHEDELLWAADELLAEERQTHPVVLSHDDLNGCEQWRIHRGGGGGGDRRHPPEWEWSLKSFFW